MASPATEIDAAGQTVRVTNPDRVIYPASEHGPEVTKLEVEGRHARVTFKISDQIKVYTSGVVIKKATSLLGFESNSASTRLPESDRSKFSTGSAESSNSMPCVCALGTLNTIRDEQLPAITAPKKNSNHWKLGTVSWAEIVGWMASPADRKECGNYVLGTLVETTVKHKPDADPCTKLHRTKQAVVSRWAVTLDVDHPEQGFWDKVDLLLPYMALLHTTYSSTPDAPRYRLIVPVDRELTPEEYHAAAGALMQLLGTANFDPGSAQAERYMFKPAAAELGHFQWLEVEGEPAPADELLANFDADLSQLPAPKPHRSKRDPFGLEGTVGAFNRAYRDDLAGLIEQYDLPYQHVRDDRWHLAGATAAAGMGPVNGVEGLYYSHHANDPAYGTTCSAFDLVRLHLFGHIHQDGGFWQRHDTAFANVTTWECERAATVLDYDPGARTTRAVAVPARETPFMLQPAHR